MDERLARVDGRLAHLDGPVAHLDERLAEVDGRLAHLDGRLARRGEGEIPVMKKVISVRMPLSEFLLEANRLAGVVSRNGERFAAATGERITARTAKDMQKLVEKILRIGRERERKTVGSIQPLVQRAEQLVTELGAAAKLVGLEKPIVTEQLKRVRSGPRRRSAVAAAWALDMHLGLARAHPKEFTAALGAAFLEDAEKTFAAIERHRDTQRSLADASVEQTRARDALVAQLHALVREVRVAAGVFARDADLVAELSPRSRRSPRQPTITRDQNGDTTRPMSDR